MIGHQQADQQGDRRAETGRAWVARPGTARAARALAGSCSPPHGPPGTIPPRHPHETRPLTTAKKRECRCPRVGARGGADDVPSGTG